MSDWDFLHDMHEKGYSADAIADAAISGASPEQWEYIARRETLTNELEEQKNLMALDGLERLRQAGSITREQFLECKAAILK